MNPSCPICSGGLGAVCDSCLANAPMRRTGQGNCAECGHAWIAPVIGNCPKCHSPNTREDGYYTNGLKRL